MMPRLSILCLCLVTLLAGCSDQDKKTKGPSLFTPISAAESGVDFANTLTFDQRFNIYTYRNFYNGGGVGLADINNDGLLDIYLTANQGPNKLYLNQGNFKFTDITQQAGVAGTKAWSTGVSMADVNGDGWVDIYVCNSGDVQGDDKENELFINNKDNTFTERAAEYGIADKGFTTHAVFFDYDRDGDLDLYILNNSYQAIGSFNLRKSERHKRDSLGGDKLFRNEGAIFTDVSEQAGIYGSVIGFGLGVTVGDINKDGWPDIYVSNDFFERDYLYLNNHDGTFREALTEQMKSICGASMGADLADINNDTYPDIFVTEMLPNKNERVKTVTTFENWDRYQYSVTNGYYHQFTRNMLQLNNGNGTFSEIGRMAKVEATDWSWGALMFDMDNDGWKDIFVANGIYQDLTNQDYLQYVSNEEVIRSVISGKNVDYKKLVELIPSNPVPNFAFHNNGKLGFENRAQEWSLEGPGFSNGSAYGDLDNDGDMDLVANNVNAEVSILRNEASQQLPENHYLKFILTGGERNTQAVGTRITVTKGDSVFYVEQVPNRGFESSMDPRPNMGLGKIDTVSTVRIEWPNGKVTVLSNVATNQVLKLNQSDAIDAPVVSEAKPSPYFVNTSFPVIDFTHVESEFVDFDRDKLVYHMLSTEGPRMSAGDLNGDGREDLFIGGAKGNAGALFIQQPSGSFERVVPDVLVADATSEDIESVIFDADQDGDQDIYVCSGSNEVSTSSFSLVDRLYVNEGRMNFTKSKQLLPSTILESTSTVEKADYDQDGDVDLFVGVRSTAFQYGKPGNGYILQNDGKGNFADVTKTVAPPLLGLGMITDATWADIDKDQDLDLLVVGEYMPITVLFNEGGKFKNGTNEANVAQTHGWWNRIAAVDLDGDSDLDFVVTNHGLNSKFRASIERPVTMTINDFDKNGSVEQIICGYNGDKSYPYVLRHDLMTQIPSLKKKYLKYESYKDQTLTDIFTPEELANAITLQATELATSILINNGSGAFTRMSLPWQAQLSPMYAIATTDVNQDGAMDIILGGNLYRVKPEMGRYDASYGVLLLGDGKGGFESVSASESGLLIDGEVRDFLITETAQGKFLIVARNNDSVVSFKMQSK